MSEPTDWSERYASQRGIYLLSHSAGLPPRALEQALAARWLGPWQAGDPALWDRWLDEIERFRGALATFLATDSELICPQANVSSGVVKALGAIAPAGGRKSILIAEDAFPTLGFVARRVVDEPGQLRFVPRGRDPADPSVWADELTDDVGVAILTHVHSNTAVRSPIAELTRLTRERGIVSIVDIAQSVGIVPIDLSDWHADFVAGSCLKWLCGAPGAGFLWIDRDRLDECRPRDVGWFSHADPFEFDIRNYRDAPDALRFLGGTPSVAPYVAATAAIETLTDIGMPAVSRHNRALTSQLIEALPNAALACPRSSDDRGGTIVVRPRASAERVAAALLDAGIAADVRSTGIRLSPHVFNAADQIDRVADELNRHV